MLFRHTVRFHGNRVKMERLLFALNRGATTLMFPTVDVDGKIHPGYNGKPQNHNSHDQGLENKKDMRAGNVDKPLTHLLRYQECSTNVWINVRMLCYTRQEITA